MKSNGSIHPNLISLEPVKSVYLNGYSKEEAKDGLSIFGSKDYLFAAKT
jgi:hypothetical protein